MADARDFIETERTPGWAAYKARVEAAIANIETDLRTIDIEGKSAEEIGLLHVRLEERITGLRRALNVGEELKKEPDADL